MSQRDAFLDGEGDAWFLRNLPLLSKERLRTDDPLLSAVRDMSSAFPKRVLEVGCGGGQRGAAIAEMTGARVSGIDPSEKAVLHACSIGVSAQVGTAEALPFEKSEFDLVIFGFCLYLCDREDLFCIAAEADRVLCSNGWIIIQDFFNPSPSSRPYHHRLGLSSFKMDYRKLFDWNPRYTCFSHRVLDHGGGNVTADPEEWTAISVLRKT